MPRYLLLRLEGPLAAYGAEMVDARGPVRDWPGASMLTGLLANALGFERHESQRLQALQDRLRFAVRIDRRGEPLRDFQTAKLEKSDKGWTTRGRPEGRDGGEGTYNSPHIRERHYFADSSVSVALTLIPASEPPTLDDLAAALAMPARPLFLGRKPCLPTQPIFNPKTGDLTAATPCDALDGFVLATPSDRDIVVVALAEADAPETAQRVHVTDQRNWVSGVHSGERIFVRSLRQAPDTKGARQ